MQIVVAARDAQWMELTANRTGAEWVRVPDDNAFPEYPEAALFFNLLDTKTVSGYAALNKPVFLDAVVETLDAMNAPGNVLRINGWPGFLQRNAWEVAGKTNPAVVDAVSTLGIQLRTVEDKPGLIAARIIAMIINEAYLALEEKVSTKDEIDTAMKLGTNYPFGPFEWAEAIGKKNVVTLLELLKKESSRYTPSSTLVNEVNLHTT